jgi:hypothetical protein
LSFCEAWLGHSCTGLKDGVCHPHRGLSDEAAFLARQRWGGTRPWDGERPGPPQVRDINAGRFANGTNLLLVTHGLALRIFLMRWFHWCARMAGRALLVCLHGGAFLLRFPQGPASRGPPVQGGVLSVTALNTRGCAATQVTALTCASWSALMPPYSATQDSNRRTVDELLQVYNPPNAEASAGLATCLEFFS